MFNKILCRLGWHSWTQWDEPRMYLGNLLQMKKCTICNKHKRNIL